MFLQARTAFFQLGWYRGTQQVQTVPLQGRGKGLQKMSLLVFALGMKFARTLRPIVSAFHVQGCAFTNGLGF